jgi:hypothetical protein
MHLRAAQCKRFKAVMFWCRFHDFIRQIGLGKRNGGSDLWPPQTDERIRPSDTVNAI